MLQGRLRLVLRDRIGDHVENVVHHGGTQLKIVVRSDTLLRNGFCDTLAVTALESTSEHVTEPESKMFMRAEVRSFGTYPRSSRGTIIRE